MIMISGFITFCHTNPKVLQEPIHLETWYGVMIEVLSHFFNLKDDYFSQLQESDALHLKTEEAEVKSKTKDKGIETLTTKNEKLIQEVKEKDTQIESLEKKIENLTIEMTSSRKEIDNLTKVNLLPYR